MGGSVIESDGNFVQPTIVEISPDASIVKEELFGPVLYVMKFKVISSRNYIHLQVWFLLRFSSDQSSHFAFENLHRL